MSDVPPPTNVFEKMMAAARTPVTVASDENDEPVYTAVLYEVRLEHADESEPLWRVPYFGQVVRVGTAEEVFATRKREHETAAAREDKDLGLHSVIDRFGPDSMAWRIVSFKLGTRTAMRALANAEEIRLIDEHGGILRDMDKRLVQTLNLTKGGQGDPRAWWDGIDARRRRAYTKFKVVMEAYVKEYESALVPQEYVHDDVYPLGQRLAEFRQGHLWKGAPWEDEAKLWAEALPKFYWDARESYEWHKNRSRLSQERSWCAFTKFKPEMEKYVKEYDSALVPHSYVNAVNYPLGKRLASFRDGHCWKGMPWENEAKVWAEALPKWEWNTTETGTYNKMRRKLATDQHATKRRDELERARPIAVPFEKSRKRRIEMRAASTDFSGKVGNSVLYMHSEDGKDIRRVQKNGNMGKRNIVGPVVDPSPPDAFDSD